MQQKYDMVAEGSQIPTNNVQYKNYSLEGCTHFRVHSLFASIFPVYEHIHAPCPVPDAGNTECHRKYDHICLRLCKMPRQICNHKVTGLVAEMGK